MMWRMEMKLKMKMENDVDVGRDQSYLKCIFIFHEIYDIRGQILYKNTLYRNFIDSNYIVWLYYFTDVESKLYNIAKSC